MMFLCFFCVTCASCLLYKDSTNIYASASDFFWVQFYLHFIFYVATIWKVKDDSSATGKIDDIKLFATISTNFIVTFIVANLLWNTWGGIFTLKYMISYGWQEFINVLYGNSSLFNVLYQLTCLARLIVIEDLCFYVIHYSFHKFTFLYKMIHQQHHEWNGNVNALATYYTSLPEHILCNLFPLALCMWLVSSSSVLVRSFFLYGAVLFSLVSHSGSLLKIPGWRFHYFHHSLRVYNYGVTGMIDYINKTIL